MVTQEIVLNIGCVDLEWKVVYVGSAYNSSLDQTLDSILVGPVPVGRHQFVFEVICLSAFPAWLG